MAVTQLGASKRRTTARTTALAVLGMYRIGVLCSRLIVNRSVRRSLVDLFDAGLGDEVRPHFQVAVPVRFVALAESLDRGVAVAAVAPELGDRALDQLPRLGVRSVGRVTQNAEQTPCLLLPYSHLPADPRAERVGLHGFS